MNQENPEVQYDEVEVLEAGASERPKRPSPKRPTKDRFTVIWSNGLLFALLSLGISVLFIFTEDKTVASFGRLAAKIAFLMMGPLVASFLVWLFFENKFASSLSFHSAALLIFVSLLTPTQRIPRNLAGGEQVNRAAQREAGKELAENKELLKKNLASTDDPEAVKNSLESYSEKTQDLLGKYAQASTGVEKKALEMVRNFTRENDRLTKTWRAAMDAYEDPRIFDYSRLRTKEEFAHQKKVVQNYITEGEGFSKRSQGAVADLAKRLEALGPNDPYVKKAIHKISGKFERQRPFFEPMMKAHLSRGRVSLDLLNLLEENQAKWTVKDGDLRTEDDEFLMKANALIETMQENVTIINQNFDQLIKTL